MHNDSQSASLCFRGIPYTRAIPWNVITTPSLTHHLTLRDFYLVCEFHRCHVRCCWARTLLDARIAEAAARAAAPSDQGTDHHRNRSGGVDVARLIDSLAAREAGVVGRNVKRCALSKLGRPSLPHRARGVVFRAQLPSVLREAPGRGAAYRLSGTVVLTASPPTSGAHPASASTAVPPFLAMAPSSGCAGYVQADPATSTTTATDELGTLRGRPQLLLLEGVDVGESGAGPAQVRTCTYASFHWLIAPAGNVTTAPRMMAARLAQGMRQKRPRVGATAAEKEKEMESAAGESSGVSPAPPPASLPLSFDLFAPVFRSLAERDRVVGEIAALCEPVQSREVHRRFGLASVDEGGEQSARRRRRHWAVYKRVRRLRSRLSGDGAGAGEGGGDMGCVGRVGGVPLVHVATLSASAAIPCESCTAAPGSQTLAAVLPGGTTFPLEVPVAHEQGHLHADAELSELHRVLASYGR